MMSNLPTYSVIVPTHNRRAQLFQCLEALQVLDYPVDLYEVIVVNDGGERLTRMLPKNNRGVLINFIDTDKGGPAAARNVGVMQSHGEYVAFVDDDCCPAPGWLTAFSALFDEHPRCLIGGKTLNGLPHNDYATASQWLIDFVFAYYERKENGRFFTSNNIALKKEMFQEIGGFSELFTLAAAEDRDLCDRWTFRGHPMIFSPEAVVHHYHALDLRRFIRQHFNYGRGAWTYHRERERRGQVPIRVEPLSFYLKLIALPYARHPLSRAIRLSLLMVISQVANGAGYYYERLVGFGNMA
jgi:GT2 family glycosyltransferase